MIGNRDISSKKAPFVRLWMAQAISQFGDALLEITLPVWVGLVTKSPMNVAGVACAELLPTLLLGPLPGVIAERVNPKRMMVATDVLRAAAVLLLLLFHSSGSAYLAYIVGFVLSFGTRMFVPAQTLVFRSMVASDDIAKVQGAFRMATSIALTLGPAVGRAPAAMMGRVSALLDMNHQTTGIAATALVAGLAPLLTSRQELLGCGLLLMATMTIIIRHRAMDSAREGFAQSGSW